MMAMFARRRAPPAPSGILGNRGAGAGSRSGHAPFSSPGCDDVEQSANMLITCIGREHEMNAQDSIRELDTAFSRLTQDVRYVLFLARQAQSRYGGETLEPEHVLLGLLEAFSNSIERFASDDWTPVRIRTVMIEAVSGDSKAASSGPVRAGAGMAAVLLSATNEADEAGSREIDIGRLLLGLLRDEGRAGQVLTEAGIVRAEVVASLRNQ